MLQHSKEAFVAPGLMNCDTIFRFLSVSCLTFNRGQVDLRLSQRQCQSDLHADVEQLLPLLIGDEHVLARILLHHLGVGVPVLACQGSGRTVKLVHASYTENKSKR